MNSEHQSLGHSATYVVPQLAVVASSASVNPFADFDLQPVKDFKIAVNAEYEKAALQGRQWIVSSTRASLARQSAGRSTGVQLARLPEDFQIRVTPSDTQIFSWGSVSEYVTYEHVGQHYQDNTGLNPLGSYYDLAAGIVATYGDKWELRLAGTNLTNQIGLTEGNARFGGNTAQNGVNFGRSILGREGNIELKYKF